MRRYVSGIKKLGIQPSLSLTGITNKNPFRGISSDFAEIPSDFRGPELRANLDVPRIWGCALSRGGADVMVTSRPLNFLHHIKILTA